MDTKLLNDTITLFNYIGERDMVAVYNITVLKNVFVEITSGSSSSTQGDTPQDSAKLFIFDRKVESLRGKEYLNYYDWLNSNNKTDFWTLRNDGKDYFTLGIAEAESPELCDDAYVIKSAIHLKKGTARMWHWEIDGR